MNTLIVPCAGRSSRFPKMKPKWMLTHPEGMTMLQKNLSALDLSKFSRVVITILKEHDEKYDASFFLKQIFPDSKFEVLILDHLTNGPAETVYETIKKAQVHGSFVVRDSDSYTQVSMPHVGENFLVGMSLKKNLQIDRIADKSFIVLNENQKVQSIVEKQVVSDTICLGIYGFKSHEEFTHVFINLKERNHPEQEVYVSHVMNEIMTFNEVHYCEASYYEDWGTLDAWKKVMSRYSSYFLDLDGVMFQNFGKYGVKNWDNTFNPIEENVTFIKELYSTGGQIILTTSRPEKYRAQIENFFNERGIKIHAMVMGINHAPRIIINDFAPTNPYPSCSAVNIPRNAMLEDYFKGANSPTGC